MPTKYFAPFFKNNGWLKAAREAGFINVPPIHTCKANCIDAVKGLLLQGFPVFGIVG
ncbi:MAG: hypothetical protein JWP69_446 [Flaviaesturariibacter sp.]|nr:hypothetical protein [Flaviaesturariibacter sp.]